MPSCIASLDHVTLAWGSFPQFYPPVNARLSHSLIIICFATRIGSLAANYSAVMLLLKLCCKKLHNSSIFWASVNWQIANRSKNIFHILVKRQIAPDASSSWQLRLWSRDLGSNPRQKVSWIAFQGSRLLALSRRQLQRWYKARATPKLKLLQDFFFKF